MKITTISFYFFQYKKNELKKKKFFVILTLIFLLFLFPPYVPSNIANQNGCSKKDVSIVINMKNLNQERHIFYSKIIKDINASVNYYFIKTFGKSLYENKFEFVENNTVKIVQSNFPDSIFLPLVLSLFGKDIPEIILFIEGEDLKEFNGNEFKNWYKFSYNLIINYQYDYIFGNSKVIEGKKIGCSLLLSKASIIQHLLYYTDSDTTHINPFIQLSLATKTKYCFVPFSYMKISNLQNIYGKFSSNMDCPLIKDSYKPSLCIILPAYKRNYWSFSIPAFANQTYKPKFYIFIQNGNRKYFNLTFIQNKLNEPIYHIWMQNWNSFFFLIHRFASVLPCNFILKYDDDEWPLDNNINEILINNNKNKNVILGGRGYFVNKLFQCYIPQNIKKIGQEIVVDHTATPFIVRPGYFKLDARNKIYSLYHAEDLSLSVNSWKLCNVTSLYMRMKLVQKHRDGNHKESDELYKLVFEKEKNVFENSYRYLVRSGYIPKSCPTLKALMNESINITISHKRLN